MVLLAENERYEALIHVVNSIDSYNDVNIDLKTDIYDSASQYILLNKETCWSCLKFDKLYVDVMEFIDTNIFKSVEVYENACYGMEVLVSISNTNIPDAHSLFINLLDKLVRISFCTTVTIKIQALVICSNLLAIKISMSEAIQNPAFMKFIYHMCEFESISICEKVAPICCNIMAIFTKINNDIPEEFIAYIENLRALISDNDSVCSEVIQRSLALIDELQK